MVYFTKCLIDTMAFTAKQMQHPHPFKKIKFPEYLLPKLHTSIRYYLLM